MPYKAIPCPICKVPRRVGGANTQHSVCRRCYDKGYGSRKWKTMVKPGRHQQFQSEQAQERQARYAAQSYWVGVPREGWGQRVEQERAARFQAAGIGKVGLVIASEMFK